MSRVLSSTIETIKSLIEDQLAPAAQLPNEQELVSLTGVSRATVREAIARLETGGLVTKVWGVGTFVSEPAPQVGFGFLSLRTGIPGILETTGGEVTVRRFEAVDQPPEAEMFPDFSEAATVSTVRVFGLDGVPVVSIQDRMVAEFGGRRLDLDPLRSAEGRLPDLLRHIGLELQCIELDISASDLDADGQSLFELSSPEPVIQTAGDGYDTEGRRILITHVMYRTRIMGLRVTASS